jgi:hypothetical protein
MDQRQEWLNSTLMELLEAIKASLPEVVWREMWMVSEVHGVVSTKTLWIRYPVKLWPSEMRPALQSKWALQELHVSLIVRSWCGSRRRGRLSVV